MGENAPVGVGQRDRLDLVDPAYARGDKANGLVHRHHRAAKGKAIVGQLRHRRPYAVASENRSSIEIAERLMRAAIASISSRWTTGRRVSILASVTIPTMPGSSWNSHGLPLAARCTSILRCGSRLKPSTRTRSTGAILASK